MKQSPSAPVGALRRNRLPPPIDGLSGSVAVGPPGDAALAELIEADGREQIEQGRAIELRRYLDAFPGLASRIVPLDAAVEVTLRSMRAYGSSPAEAARTLAGNYPELAEAIHDAAALADEIVRTSELGDRVEERPTRALPAEFGPPLREGRARYELLALLGRGSTGAVFRGVDRLLSDSGHDAMVAVKVLERTGTAWSRERFIEEATKARRVAHPNVVRVIDRGVTDEGEEFIVYEHEEGGDLHEYMESVGTKSHRWCVQVVIGIARGVQAAHSAGLVHCDLKPGNILMTKEGMPKVADFGVAVRRDPTAPAAAWGGGAERIGNVAFISPEQFRMKPGALVPRSDIYAIGGILFWMLTGRLPNGSSVEEVEHTHDPQSGRSRAPSVRAFRRGIDRDLDAICAKCLAPRPDERYESAAQLVEDLDAWSRFEPIKAAKPSSVRRTRLWVRRRPALASSLGVLGVLVVGSAAVFVYLQSAVSAAYAELLIREEKRQATVVRLKALINFMGPMLEDQSPWSFMPLVPHLDWAFGTDVLGDPAEDRPAWRDRIEIVRKMVVDARERHGPVSFQTAGLESTLAFWLLVEYRPDEAEQLLASNREAWRKLLPEDEVWHEWLGGLSACATIQRLSAASRTALTEAEMNEACGAARVMESVHATLASGPNETSFRRMIERTLGETYGPKLLDDPRRASKYVRR